MPPPCDRRLLLVGWDAADWALIHPLLDCGLLPNLARLVEQGVSGKMETLQPALSPILWNSIATGKTGDQHGILGFLEPDPIGGGVRPVASSSRKVKALWNMLSESGLSSVVLNWFASHPAEEIRGASVSNLFPKAVAPWNSPWPMAPDSVYPGALREILAELRVHAGELTGDDLLPFIPRLGEIDQKADQRPLELAAVLAETISVHAAATWLMQNRPWDFAAIYFDAIDRLGHTFMRCHPPRLPGVSERDFEHYQEVMKGIYCFQDMLLGRLVDLAGSETTVIVVSDHGFESGIFRPDLADIQKVNPLAWHRTHGVFAMAGPGIRRDELVYGAGLLDIAPTILTLFGLPAGADMPGRVLSEAFEEPPAISSIPTWESTPGGTAADGARIGVDGGGDSWAAAAVLAQLADLGYIDSPGENAAEQLETIGKDRDFNLIRVYLTQGRPADAIPLLEKLAADAPEPRKSYLEIFLAHAQFRTGRLAEARRLLDGLLERNPNFPEANLVSANLALTEGDQDRAVACLGRAEAGWRNSPLMQHLPGQIYLRTGRFDDAERCFRIAISHDSDAAHSHAGLARCLLEKGRFQEAADEALEAIGLKYNLPGSHYVLGVALAQLGRVDRAIQAFEGCLRLAPGTMLAHEWLGSIHERAGNAARAAEHRARVSELRAAVRRAA